jgi:spermidine/putrescine transport system substrate-binding protein
MVVTGKHDLNRRSGLSLPARRGEETMRHARDLSRREFLVRAGGTAAAVPTLSAILDACSKPGASVSGSEALQIARPDNPVTLPMNGEPIATDTPIEQGATIQILNWSVYMWKYVINQFIQQYSDNGIKFSGISTFNNMDEGVQKLQSGKIQADVFFPTIDVLGKLVAADLLQPLNHDLIPALAQDNWAAFQNPYYDQGWRYSVPYTIYTTGIGYRRDQIPDEQIHGMDNPWSILWDPTYKGRVGVYPSYRDVMAIALMKNGITDLNTGNDADLEKVRTDLLAMIDATSPRIAYDASYNKLQNDKFSVTTAWSGDVVAGWSYAAPYTEAAYKGFGYWFPADRKGPIDNDLIAIPKNAPHPRLAHEFINFWISFRHAMDNFSWNGYQPPQTKADINTLTQTEGLYSKQSSSWAAPADYVAPWMPDAVVRESDFGIGYREGPLPPDVDDHWHQIWSEFTAGVGS